MRINKVTLENIRSHAKSETNFVRGFNCLVGGLGTGKSSILYAIDFALFGDPLARSYSYLLRKGEETGKVSVEFSLNGKAYRVERSLRRHANGISQDAEGLNFFEENRSIASMRNEAVAEQLEAITGLNKEIFRQIIWVRQEHLKELLDVAPRERQKRLDKLFGLSDYEVAWNNIRSIQRMYEVEKKTRQEDIDVLGLEKLEEDYHRALDDFAAVDTEIISLTRGLQQAEAALHAASTKLQSLEDLRKETEELLKKEATLQTNITNTEDRCAQLADDLQKEKATTEDLQQRLMKLESQLKLRKRELQDAGLNPDSSLEQLTSQVTSFDNQITSIKAELEAGRKDSKTCQEQASSLGSKNQCPLCLQPIDEDYKKHMLKHFEEEAAEREKRVSELEKNLNELGKLRNVTRQVLSEFQSSLPIIKDLNPRILKALEFEAKLKQEFEDKQQQEKMLRSELENVRTEIARFDMSQLEFTRKQYETAADQFRAKEIKLQYSQERKKESSLKIEELRRRLENAHQKVERVERISKMLETIEGIRSGYQSIQPKLRTEFVKILQNTIQQVLDSLRGEEDTGFVIQIDETYTPTVKSPEGYELEVAHLSGGERTLLAFAYRFALGQLIMQARTGHGLQMLLLDEPTESLGREDRSVDRLAEAIARLKAIEQIIAVTHNEAFAEKADYVIRLEKEIDVSKILPEK